VILVELRALLRRPRTWVSIALLAGLPTVVALFLAESSLAPRPGTGPAFLAQVTTNGALYPAAALALVLPLFLPIAVSVVAGEAVAGEAQQGTLRYLLLRPVGRTTLLVAKLVSIVVYVALAVVIVAGVAYVVGTHLFGTAPLPSLSGGPPLTTEQASGRMLLAVAYVGISMLGVGSFALALSTVTDSPLAATLGALAVLVTSQVLDLLEAAGPVRGYLPTHYWLAFVDLFRNPVLWRDLERGTLLQLAYVAVLLLASWAHFQTKDITS
jgi:ABC-2 type transport system permease protein